MKLSYNDLLMVAFNLNEIVVQELPVGQAVPIATFATEIEEKLSAFEERRSELFKLDEEERESQFHTLLGEEIELTQISFSGFGALKIKPATVMLFKRLGLW